MTNVILCTIGLDPKVVNSFINRSNFHQSYFHMLINISQIIWILHQNILNLGIIKKLSYKKIDTYN